MQRAAMERKGKKKEREMRWKSLLFPKLQIPIYYSLFLSLLLEFLYLPCRCLLLPFHLLPAIQPEDSLMHTCLHFAMDWLFPKRWKKKNNNAQKSLTQRERERESGGKEFFFDFCSNPCFFFFSSCCCSFRFLCFCFQQPKQTFSRLNDNPDLILSVSFFPSLLRKRSATGKQGWNGLSI